MGAFFIATIAGPGSLYDYYSGLARELASRGRRVVILVDRRAHRLERDEAGVRVAAWPSMSPTRPADAAFLDGLVGEYRPACIISSFSAVNICTVVGWWRRVPVRAFWSHTLSAQIELDEPMPALKRRLLVRRRGMVLRLATHAIANSEAMKRDLQDTFGVRPERTRVLRFRLPDPGILRPGEERRGIVYAGRLSPSKGLDVLLRAMPRVRASVPDVALELLGDGPMRGACEGLARELGVSGICRFRGAVPHGEVLERMASAAVQVSPSLREAFGLVNLEAHGVGTPVVASRVDGIPEVVVDGVTGLLVSPGDPAALADALTRLLLDEKLRQDFGRAARSRFQREFGMEGIRSHADYFEGLLPKGTRGG